MLGRASRHVVLVPTFALIWLTKWDVLEMAKREVSKWCLKVDRLWPICCSWWSSRLYPRSILKETERWGLRFFLRNWLATMQFRFMPTPMICSCIKAVFPTDMVSLRHPFAWAVSKRFTSWMTRIAVLKLNVATHFWSLYVHFVGSARHG